MKESTYILLDKLENAEYDLQKDIRERESYLNHQKRDLSGCWHSEKESREREIKELEEELTPIKEAWESIKDIIREIERSK